MNKRGKRAVFVFATMVLPTIGVILWLLRLDELVGFVLLVSILVGVEMNFLNKVMETKVHGYVHVEVDKGGFKRANLVVSGDPEVALEQEDILVFKVVRDEEAP